MGITKSAVLDHHTFTKLLTHYMVYSSLANLKIVATATDVVYANS